MTETVAPPQHESKVVSITTPHTYSKELQFSPQKEAINLRNIPVQKAPKINPEPEITTTTPKPVYGASFTTDISSALERSDISIDWVNPIPLGEGANHKVYSYSVPGEPERVIKIAKEKSTTTLTHGGAQGEEEGFRIARDTFGDFTSKTEIKVDPKNADKYFVVQEAVKGKSISNKRFKESNNVRIQLAEIVKLNNKLYGEKKMCLDFVGMAGFTGWLKKQFGKLLLRKSEFEVSNIIEGEDGKLKIIDFEYFNLADHVSLHKRFTNFIGMTVNRVLMKHYFGLDIKK